MCRLAQEVRSLRVAGEGVRYEAVWLREAPHAQAEERYRSAAEAVRGRILRLRNRLVWVNAGAGPDRIALPAGELDEEALYRAKFAADLFRRREDGPYRVPPLDLVLLADASRSMKEPLPGGDVPKYIAAQRLAALFVEALEPLAPIRAWVFSYTSVENRVELRELYTPGRHADKTRIGDLYPAGQTPEYEALAAVSRFIRETGGKRAAPECPRCISSSPTVARTTTSCPGTRKSRPSAGWQAGCAPKGTRSSTWPCRPIASDRPFTRSACLSRRKVTPG